MSDRTRSLPGVERPSRFRPKFHYELLVCGLAGHELIGLDAEHFREADRPLAREIDGVRWHRCVRCDSWLPVAPPERFSRRHPPDRDEIILPLRGRPLRDKIVLRAIAIDRAVHFIVLAVLSVAVFLVASNRSQLHDVFYRVLTDIQGGVGGAVHAPHRGILGEIDKVLSLRSNTLHLVGAGLAVYAVLEAVEAVGLWYQKRWAEYLTFVATTLLIPLEVYELTLTVSPLKLTALLVNLAIVVYLLLAKRLFGLRGGAAADEEERRRDVGWRSLEETAPEAVGGPSAPEPSVSG
jgi:uncharacterized membrane protein (DUF2068 family)